MKASRVELHVETLIFEGLEVRDRAGVARAVERELARLLAELGVPAGRAMAEGARAVDAGSAAVAANRPADALGARVARAVYGGLDR